MVTYFNVFLDKKKKDSVCTRVLVSHLAIVIYRLHLPVVTFAVLKRNILRVWDSHTQLTQLLTVRD